MSGAARIYRPSPLAYPGSAPRFDPSHPAAQGYGFSLVATPNGLLNLEEPTSFSGGAGVSFPVDGQLGPVVSFPGSGNQGIQWSPHNANYPTVSIYTLAMIFRQTATSSFSNILGTSVVNTGGYVLIGQSGPVIEWWVKGNSLCPVSFSNNVPYFLAMSGGAAGVNAVLVRLDTGATKTVTSASSGVGTSSGSGASIGAQGASSRPYTGEIACAMGAPVFLSLPQLLQWAQRPWDFWYPPVLGNLIFGSLASVSGGSTVALAAMLAARSRGQGAPTGALGLSAALTAKGRSFVALSGAVPLAAKATSLARAKALPSGLLPLSAKAAARSKVSGSIAGTVPLAAKLQAASRSRGTLAAALALSARLTASMKGQATAAGVVALQGMVKTASAARGSLSFAGFVVLVARMRASSAGRGSASGTLPLAAKATAKASGASGLGARVGLAALLGARGSAKGAASGAVGLSALLTARASGRASFVKRVLQPIQWATARIVRGWATAKPRTMTATAYVRRMTATWRKR
jgi:hypothetical protein